MSPLDSHAHNAPSPLSTKLKALLSILHRYGLIDDSDTDDDAPTRPGEAAEGDSPRGRVKRRKSPRSTLLRTPGGRAGGPTPMSEGEEEDDDVISDEDDIEGPGSMRKGEPWPTFCPLLHHLQWLRSAVNEFDL